MSPKPTSPLLPPRWAGTLVRRVVPRHAEPETILGDLHQEFDEEVETGRTGMASLRYSMRAVEIVIRYTLLGWKERLLPHHGRWRTAGPERRDDSGGELMGSLIADIRYGIRMLGRTPLLTVTGALTIALGVALTTHTFSAVYGSLMRPADVDVNGDLRYLQQTWPTRNIGRMTMIGLHDFERLVEQQTSFTQIAGFDTETANLAGDGNPPERFGSTVGTWNLLDLAGVQPLMGRVHREGEDGPGSPRLAVISHRMWQGRFGGRDDILGRDIRISGTPYEVIGVMPAGFQFPFDEDLWVTHQEDADLLEPRTGRFFEALGRLKPGVTEEQALAEWTAINSRTVQEFIETHEGIGASIQGFADRRMPPEIGTVLWAMLFAVFGVLLIAAANVANLLLARATARGREVAIRTALGAGRKRMIRQLLVESVMLGLLGGAIGVVMAWAGLIVFNNAIVDIEKPYWIDIRLDGIAMTFSIVVTLVAALVAGAVPAIKASGGGVGAILRDETRGSSSLRMGRFSNVLVVSELAVSCALLVGAGLMIRSVVNLKNMDMGFDGADVMTGMLVLPESEYAEDATRDNFWGELEQQLRSQPGVLSVAISGTSPGTGSSRWSFGVQGRTYATDADYEVTNVIEASAGYFETFDIPVVQGRTLSEAEWRLEGDPVAVVSESFVRRYFPDEDPIGAQIRPGRSASELPWMTIVGVVGDVFNSSGDVGGLGTSSVTGDILYAPLMYFPPRFGVVSIEASGDVQAFAQVARTAVTDIDPNLPLYNVGTADEALAYVNWSFGLFGTLFAIFGAVALFLAAVGLYGVMAFSVGRRRQEMGVRMALGADRRDILGLVARSGMGQLALGVGLGLTLGALASKPLEIALLGVDTLDPVVYATIALSLGLTGLLATMVPALRATRVDPNTALRPE